MTSPNTIDIQAVAALRAEELPGSEIGNPFGPDWDVWKVRGKVFMLQTNHSGEALVTLKATPADSNTLREAFASIERGYHMNKKHWITLKPGPDLDTQLVRDLVTESYLLVVEKMPRARRPVDPDTFGQTPG